MQILLFFIFWLIGVFVTSFTFIPILIIFVFGIPTTKKLEKLKALKENNGIIKKYYLSVIILTIFMLFTLFVISKLFPNNLVSFLFGGGVVCLFGLGQIGRNEKNIHDYIESNKASFLNNPQMIRYVIMGWK